MNPAIEKLVREHGNNLLAIFPAAKEQDPIKLCLKLRRLEGEGERLALRLCNGPEFKNEDEADAVAEKILIRVNAILKNDKIPIILNRDPRGYALKIDDEWMRNNPHFRLHRDMGGYGIIAPDLNR